MKRSLFSLLNDQVETWDLLIPVNEDNSNKRLSTDLQKVKPLDESSDLEKKSSSVTENRNDSKSNKQEITSNSLEEVIKDDIVPKWRIEIECNFDVFVLFKSMKNCTHEMPVTSSSDLNSSMSNWIKSAISYWYPCPHQSPFMNKFLSTSIATHINSSQDSNSDSIQDGSSKSINPFDCLYMRKQNWQATIACVLNMYLIGNMDMFCLVNDVFDPINDNPKLPNAIFRRTKLSDVNYQFTCIMENVPKRISRRLLELHVDVYVLETALDIQSNYNQYESQNKLLRSTLGTIDEIAKGQTLLIQGKRSTRTVINVYLELIFNPPKRNVVFTDLPYIVSSMEFLNCNKVFPQVKLVKNPAVMDVILHKSGGVSHTDKYNDNTDKIDNQERKGNFILPINAIWVLQVTGYFTSQSIALLLHALIRTRESMILSNESKGFEPMTRIGIGRNSIPTASIDYSWETSYKKNFPLNNRSLVNINLKSQVKQLKNPFDIISFPIETFSSLIQLPEIYSDTVSRIVSEHGDSSELYSSNEIMMIENSSSDKSAVSINDIERKKDKVSENQSSYIFIKVLSKLFHAMSIITKLDSSDFTSTVCLDNLNIQNSFVTNDVFWDIRNIEKNNTIFISKLSIPQMKIFKHSSINQNEQEIFFQF